MSRMSIFAVEYTYDERRDEQDAVRPEHRTYLRGLAEQGTLLASGPWADGAPGALLVLRTDDAATLDALLADDPFARAGLIASTTVRGWNVVIGGWPEPAPL
jgi:uncharacterized protein YciI